MALRINDDYFRKPLGYGLDDQGFESHQGQDISLVSKTFRRASSPSPPLSLLCNGCRILGY